MRLNKFLAAASVASRRGSDDLIRSGRVWVNGRLADGLGTVIDPAVDTVAVDGRRVEREASHAYILLNKPCGVLTTVSDPFGRRTVMDLLTGVTVRVFPVGRLDCDTEGLLLLTNDGGLAQAVTHPRFELDKEYEVLVKGQPTPASLQLLAAGVLIDGRRTAPATVRAVAQEREGARLSITIHEGRKRQIRRMCRLIEHPVLRLRRIRLGPLTVDDIPVGRWRTLTDGEILALKHAVGLGTADDYCDRRSRRIG